MPIKRYLLLVTVFVLAAGLPLGSILAGVERPKAANATPVWGTRPVLGYFALTAGLREKMKAETGLTETEFQAVQAAGHFEMEQLEALEQASLEILRDEGASMWEKRMRIAEMGFNERVNQVIEKSQSTLQEILDEPLYTRLVAWIEHQWVIERELHGSPQVVTAPNGARTYSLYATWYDSGGAYTVALPDQCVKHANSGKHLCDDSGYATGKNYSVRLKYQQTATVKVLESGPWNVDDNFWSGSGDPQPRRLFPDLPTGMPEAQAAYFNNYNNGKDQFGRTVVSPYAIDLSELVRDDIGMSPGSPAWIDVTMLWTEGWDDIRSDVAVLTSPSTLTPPYSGDMCVTAWHRIDGYDDHAYLTLNVDDPNQSTNSGEWTPNIPVTGDYEVLAFVPDHAPIDWLCPAKNIGRDTSDARYAITHAKGQKMVSGNQGPLSNMWIDLGTYHFNKGKSGKVTLSDLNGEANLSHTVAFSAMLFRRLVYPTPTPEPSPTLEPTPTLTPTPTATPAPYTWTGFGIVAPTQTITIPVGANYLDFPGLGASTIDLHYDPAALEPVACQANPNGDFDGGSCTLDYEHDGINPDIVRFELNSAAGLAGDRLLARVTFQALGASGNHSPLDVLLQVFNTPGGLAIPAQAYPGLVCIAPCRNLGYLPLFITERVFK